MMSKRWLITSILCLAPLLGCSDDSSPSKQDGQVPIGDNGLPIGDSAAPITDGGVPLSDAAAADATTPASGWALSAGGPMDGPAYGVAVDSAGNVYAVGTFTGTAAFEAHSLTATGDSDAFLAKVDSTGHFQWAISGQASAGHDAEAYGVAADAAGNSYIVGEFSGTLTFNTTTLTSAGARDIFVAKFNSAGQVQWARSYGGGGWDRGHAIALDGTGNVLIAGDFEQSFNIGATPIGSAGQVDAFVAKLTSDGTPVWAVSGGGTGLECDFGFCGVAADGVGNVYLAAYFEETASFGGKEVTAVGSYDLVVVKYDASGVAQWATSGGGPGEDYGQGIAVDNAGNVYLTGSFEGNATFGTTQITSAGSSDVIVARLSPEGVFTWVKAGAGSGYGEGFAIATDGAGNGCLVGTFIGDLTLDGKMTSNVGGRDILLARFDANGTFSRVQSAGSAATDEGDGVARDSLGRCYVAGSISGAANAGGHFLTNAGGSDALIWRADP